MRIEYSHFCSLTISANAVIMVHILNNFYILNVLVLVCTDAVWLFSLWLFVCLFIIVSHCIQLASENTVTEEVCNFLLSISVRAVVMVQTLIISELNIVNFGCICCSLYLCWQDLIIVDVYFPFIFICLCIYYRVPLYGVVQPVKILWRMQPTSLLSLSIWWLVCAADVTGCYFDA